MVDSDAYSYKYIHTFTYSHASPCVYRVVHAPPSISAHKCITNNALDIFSDTDSPPPAFGHLYDFSPPAFGHPRQRGTLFRVVVLFSAGGVVSSSITQMYPVGAIDLKDQGLPAARQAGRATPKALVQGLGQSGQIGFIKLVKFFYVGAAVIIVFGKSLPGLG